MPALARSLPALLTLLAGAALGYAYGTLRPAESRTMTTASIEAAPGSPPEARSGPRNEELHQLKAFLSRSTDREAILWLRLRWGEFTSEDYAAATTDVIALGIGRHEALFGELLEAWGQAAPREAIAFAEKQPKHLKKPALQAIIRGWSNSDPDALLAWYESQKGEYLIGKLKATITEALATVRPEAAFQLITEKNEESNHQSLYTLFASLAKASPQQALQFFERFDASEQQLYVNSFLAGWSSIAPDAAAAWVASQPKGSLREKGYQTLVMSLIWSSPREAAELAAKELTDPMISRNAAYMIAQVWGSSAPEEAERFFAQQPDSPLKKEVLRMIETQWASLHPVDYLNHAIEKGGFSQDAFLALNTAVHTLAQKDSKELQRWFTENRSEIPPDQLSRLITNSASTNPEGAAHLLTLIPEGAQADNSYRSVAMNWARQDIAAARQFLSTLPEGSARNQFQAALIGRLAETNLPEALREIEGVADAALQKTLLSSAAQQTKAPQDFARWLQSRPQDNKNAALYGEITQRWFRADPAATAAWIETLPAGAAQQKSIETYAVEMTGNDPKAAIEWAQRIDNAKSREATLTRIVSQWHRADEAAAADWVKESSLPEKVKKRYLKD